MPNIDLPRRIDARFWRLGALAIFASALGPVAVLAANDAYSPDAGGYAAPAGDAYNPDEIRPVPEGPQSETYEPVRPLDGSPRDSHRGGNYAPADNGGYGEPYSPDATAGREERYEPVPPEAGGGPPEDDSRFYSQNEIVKAGHGFFGSVSGGLASAIEWAFQKAGRPNGYILGEDAGGALVAGVRYGEGKLHTKDLGSHRVYWQGPSVGYDFGAEGSKVMVLVYNLSHPSEIYNRFGGVQGAAYVIGGVGVQLQKSGDVTLAPIRSGIGLRLGANVGYLKYTRNPTWNPF